MWFKREQKNRRLNRGHVLDVKLRSSQVHATRVRLVSLALVVTFGTVFGLYLFWRAGEWALNHFIYENPEFAIQHIDVQTDGVISTEQLRRWSGVKVGNNLLALDLANVKRNLELVSTIESVSVERVLPCTLRLSVTERDPIAQVDIPGASAGKIEVTVFQFDADGYVMQPVDPCKRVMPLSEVGGQLPVIVGMNIYELQPGCRVDSPQAQAALQLIAAFEESPMAGLADLRRIDVSSPEVLIATTEQGSEITFGLKNFDQQLRRWREVYDLGVQMNKAIASLDLSIPNNIPALWMEARSIPVSAPKFTKPTHIRRKNV